jgi:aminodeoxyfutalosine synthase
MVSLLELARDIYISDRALFPIWDAVQEERRLTPEQGVTILQTDDFAGVGRIADFAKKRVTGDKVYFVLNRHINPTNLCVLSCKFCDFAKKPGDEGAYEMSMEEILSHMDNDIREVHIVGGHHPQWPLRGDGSNHP